MRKNHFQVSQITPTEFEIQVEKWLRHSCKTIKNFHVRHLEKIEGDSGEYEIDVTVELEIFSGASIKILVECKHYKNPIKRDVLMILESKIRDTNSHKGIIFTTSNFQSGALKYAQARGIATVVVQDGKASYSTKFFEQSFAIPSWRPKYKYIGWMITLTEEENVAHHLIADDYNDAINEWLNLSAQSFH
jgi:restriction system protein